MQAHVAKWGNSLAIRLPKNLAAEAKFSEGDVVEIRIENGRLIIEAEVPRYSLADLLKKVTSKNLHQETDSGVSVGLEAW
jgi:antitoxin MazE